MPSIDGLRVRSVESGGTANMAAQCEVGSAWSLNGEMPQSWASTSIRNARRRNVHVLQIKADCAARALEDAGLQWSDVDGLYDAQDGAGMLA